MHPARLSARNPRKQRSLFSTLLVLVIAAGGRLPHLRASFSSAHLFACFLDSFQKRRQAGRVMSTHGPAARDPSGQNFERTLKDAGLRVTAPRIAVLEWLGLHSHSTAEQVASGVRAGLGSVSTQAIYDVLNACVTAALVRRIEPAGHPARFETRIGDNHHHVVCRKCGLTEDVDCAADRVPCLEPSGETGFVIDEAEIIFWGLCSDCRQSP
jgi:Fur family ferric uptake transcriptional regulator